jgi:hypothetical protein
VFDVINEEMVKKDFYKSKIESLSILFGGNSMYWGYRTLPGV